MIITLKKEAEQQKIDQLIHRFESMGLQVTVIYGENYNVFGLVGDTSKVDEKNVMANPIVANVQRVDEPYKLVNRKFHPEDTIIDVNGIQIGGKKIVMIAGPLQRRRRRTNYPYCKRSQRLWSRYAKRRSL